jgi:hypothetical protein
MEPFYIDGHCVMVGFGFERSRWFTSSRCQFDFYFVRIFWVKFAAGALGRS